jgi:hypothetical protein
LAFSQQLPVWHYCITAAFFGDGRLWLRLRLSSVDVPCRWQFPMHAALSTRCVVPADAGEHFPAAALLCKCSTATLHGSLLLELMRDTLTLGPPQQQMHC